MRDVVFELLSADRAKQVIWTRLRLFDHIGILFLRRFLIVHVFQIFHMLVFEIVEIVLSVLSLIR